MTTLDTSMAVAAHKTVEPGDLCPSVEKSVKFIVRGDQDETAATIWMRLLCRGRHEGIMLIVAAVSS